MMAVALIDAMLYAGIFIFCLIGILDMELEMVFRR
jgi:hypothetical protein